MHTQIGGVLYRDTVLELVLCDFIERAGPCGRNLEFDGKRTERPLHLSKFGRCTPVSYSTMEKLNEQS